MKNVILILATFSILAKPLWPILEYVVNYDYIVTTLCENKDKPELECNGKCHLSKQLAKEAGNEDKNPFSSKTFNPELPQVLISEKITDYLFAFSVEDIKEQEVHFRSLLYSSLFIFEIPHPPRVA